MEPLLVSLLVLILGNVIYLERKTSRLDEKVNRIEKILNNMENQEGR